MRRAPGRDDASGLRPNPSARRVPIHAWCRRLPHGRDFARRNAERAGVALYVQFTWRRCAGRPRAVSREPARQHILMNSVLMAKAHRGARQSCTHVMRAGERGATGATVFPAPAAHWKRQYTPARSRLDGLDAESASLGEVAEQRCGSEESRRACQCGTAPSSAGRSRFSTSPRTMARKAPDAE